MTKKQKQKRIEEIKDLLTFNGFVVDSWGNYKKDSYRVKLKKINVRVERKAGKNWFNIFSIPIVKDESVVKLNSFLERINNNG